jgi:predicted O-methyltransferase YrrM
MSGRLRSAGSVADRVGVKTPSLPYARAILLDGAMPERELAFLYGAALSMPAGALVVEIGSFKGRSSVAICEGLRHVPGARFVAVDPWRRKSMLDKDTFGEDDPDADTIYERFLRNTADYDFVTAMRTTSVQASAEFEDESVHWIFIDGDHTLPAVRADLRTWYPKLKPGGLLSGHDYDWWSVRWAVASHFARVSAWEAIWHVRKVRGTLPARPHARAVGTAQAALRRLARRGV